MGYPYCLSNLFATIYKGYGAPINIALFYWVTGQNTPPIFLEPGATKILGSKKNMILTTNLLGFPMIMSKPQVGLILHAS